MACSIPNANAHSRANQYQDEESEQWIGEWLATRGVRGEIVLATKYSSGYKVNSSPARIQSNFGGNGSKSLHLSVEASLGKLRTSYVDLLYVHYWDLATTTEELMQSLNALVQARKVLYLGVSDAPAWWVVKCNDYARQHGLRAFSVYQGRWSAAARDLEREVIGMLMTLMLPILKEGARNLEQAGLTIVKPTIRASEKQGEKCGMPTCRESRLFIRLSIWTW